MTKSPTPVSKKAEKRRFKDRRKALLSSAEVVQRSSAKVFIVVRRSNNFYCYNSEESQAWLPWDDGNVRPLFQNDETLHNYELDIEAYKSYGEETTNSEVNMSMATCDDLTQLGGLRLPSAIMSNNVSEHVSHTHHDCFIGTPFVESSIEGSFAAVLGKDATQDPPLNEPVRRRRISPPIYDTKTANRRSASSKPPLMRKFSSDRLM